MTRSSFDAKVESAGSLPFTILEEGVLLRAS